MSEQEAFYSVDRLERAVAVLVGDDGERERRLQAARDRLERLRGTDPGGDVVL